MDKKLTNKQNRFIEEYLVDSNGAAAYVRAGFSPNGANAGAPRLLANVSIKEEIKKRQAITSKKLEITREGILSGAKKMIEVYDTLIELSLKEKLSETEQGQFARLMMILRASDANKAREILLKANGWESLKEDDESKTIESININIVRKSDDEK